MFVCTLDQWDSLKQLFPEIFDNAVFFLKNLDPAIEPGRKAIAGDTLFASVDTGRGRPAEERRFEAHRRYIDVQMLLDGAERHDYCVSAPGACLEDRLDANDVAFYTAPEDGIETIRMRKGQMIFYFPGELHAPGLADGEGVFKKVVVKIDASCL